MIIPPNFQLNHFNFNQNALPLCSMRHALFPAENAADRKNNHFF
jgi:hypothetical protein